MASKPAHAKVVFVESPYSGDIDRNVRYLMLCGHDSFMRGRQEDDDG
jgi:hypothetical protein